MIIGFYSNFELENIYIMKKILVLGGGADQIDLIQDLKERGYFTILVDYYENPIAKSYADKHICESTLDQEKVLEIAKCEKVENIITACTDQALLTVAFVAEKLGFKTQFSVSQAKEVTNKLYMKSIMLSNGIPTSRYLDTDTIDDLNMDLCYPLMIKPADCNGSFGVRKANNENDLKSFFQYASQASRTGRAIIEEFKEGIEVGIDCYILDGKAQILMMGQVNKKKIGENVLLIYQTIIPAKISECAKNRIQKIANAIAKAFDLNNTPLLIQTLVNDDEVNVIEFAPRIGGASKHRTIHIKTGFDILHANIGSSILGEVPVIRTEVNPYMYSRNHIYAYPCIFDRIDNYLFLIENGIIEELIPFKTSGMSVGEHMASRDRVGSFLVKGKTERELHEKIMKTINTIAVLDMKGNNVIKKEIYY